MMDPLACRVLLNESVRHLARLRSHRKSPQASKVEDFAEGAGGTKDARNKIMPYHDMRLYLCPSVAKQMRKGKAKQQREIQAEADQAYKEKHGDTL